MWQQLAEETVEKTAKGIIFPSGVIVKNYFQAFLKNRIQLPCIKLRMSSFL